jgi:hypothetical protein
MRTVQSGTGLNPVPAYIVSTNEPKEYLKVINYSRSPKRLQRDSALRDSQKNTTGPLNAATPPLSACHAIVSHLQYLVLACNITYIQPLYLEGLLSR